MSFKSLFPLIFLTRSFRVLHGGSKSKSCSLFQQLSRKLPPKIPPPPPPSSSLFRCRQTFVLYDPFPKKVPSRCRQCSSIHSLLLLLLFLPFHPTILSPFLSSSPGRGLNPGPRAFLPPSLFLLLVEAAYYSTGFSLFCKDLALQCSNPKFRLAAKCLFYSCNFGESST